MIRPSFRFFFTSGQRSFFHCRIACSCRDILPSREGWASARTMKAKYRPVNRRARPIVCICLLSVLLAWPAKSIAHDEWFRGLDLEPALGEASLVLAGRVVDVSRTGITVGGKGERTLLQFKFGPVLTLKGVFSRESLSLTSDDIGIQGINDAAPLEPGQLRLLILARSSQGYAIQRQSSSLEQAVPLLAALERRSLLAVQTPGVMETIAPHLSDPSPAVREQAARTLHSLLQDDYLEQPKLREGAVKALAASLEMADSNFAPRVAAFETLGAAGARAVENKSAKAQLELDAPATFAEQAARLHAIGQLEMRGQEGAVRALLKQLPLDAPPTIQRAAEWALAHLDPMAGVKDVTLRTKEKYDTALTVVTEINVLGDLPPADAVPALLDVSKLTLDRTEQYAFALFF